MSTGLKVWLWIVLIANAITGVLSMIAAVLAPVLWISVIMNAVIIAGAIMLLRMKRIGFFIICGAAAVSFIINVIGQQNIIVSLISAVVMPLIIYLLMRKDWDNFA